MPEWLIGALGSAPIWVFVGYCIGGLFTMNKPDDPDSYFR